MRTWRLVDFRAAHTIKLTHYRRNPVGSRQFRRMTQIRSPSCRWPQRKEVQGTRGEQIENPCLSVRTTRAQGCKSAVGTRTCKLSICAGRPGIALAVLVVGPAGSVAGTCWKCAGTVPPAARVPISWTLTSLGTRPRSWGFDQKRKTCFVSTSGRSLDLVTGLDDSLHGHCIPNGRYPSA